MTDIPAGTTAGFEPAPASERAVERERRLLDGVAGLRGRAGAVIDGERLLFVLGAVLVPLGFLLILLAWYGASGSGVVFEQMPYLISGGVGGLGLMICGGFLYIAWWLTRQVRLTRENHAQLLEKHEQLAAVNDQLVAAVTALTHTLATGRPPDGTGARRRIPLRADP